MLSVSIDPQLKGRYIDPLKDSFQPHPLYPLPLEKGKGKEFSEEGLAPLLNSPFRLFDGLMLLFDSLLSAI